MSSLPIIITIVRDTCMCKILSSHYEPVGTSQIHGLWNSTAFHTLCNEQCIHVVHEYV